MLVTVQAATPISVAPGSSATVTAPQPGNAVPFSLKATLLVRFKPASVARNTVVVPTTGWLGVATTLNWTLLAFTNCTYDVELLGLLASPLYDAR